jgi:aspartate carbamoyltransferase catalytic subunit
MIPMGVETLGAHITYHVEEAIKDADVVMVLRIQKERQQAFVFPSEREYAQCYGLTEEKLVGAKEDVLIMHPGPINRGVEIAPEVAEGPYSVILDQVTNGVAIRMALLYLLLGGPR